MTSKTRGIIHPAGQDLIRLVKGLQNSTTLSWCVERRMESVITIMASAYHSGCQFGFPQ